VGDIAHAGVPAKRQRSPEPPPPSASLSDCIDLGSTAARPSLREQVTNKASRTDGSPSLAGYTIPRRGRQNPPGDHRPQAARGAPVPRLPCRRAVAASGGLGTGRGAPAGVPDPGAAQALGSSVSRARGGSRHFGEAWASRSRLGALASWIAVFRAVVGRLANRARTCTAWCIHLKLSPSRPHPTFLWPIGLKRRDGVDMLPSLRFRAPHPRAFRSSVANQRQDCFYLM
jgi:hypothetical protein